MITVTLYSNFLNHHQLPFCIKMQEILGENFRFVATKPIDDERLKMGYENMNNSYPFVIRSYEDTTSLKIAMTLCEESDVAIFGSAPEIFFTNRMKVKKLTFRYVERIFKKGRWRAIDPRIFSRLLFNHSRYRKCQVYLLCAGAYAAGDFSIVGAYPNKTFKWGYFPQNQIYDIKSLIDKKQKEVTSLLWVGRFIEWKHPDKALEVAVSLRDKGIKFSLKLIGGGDMDLSLKKIVKEMNLSEQVEFLGFLSPNEVRTQMEDADVFLFTSDSNEGWGAVLNEAMNSGCAVVASRSIGSVPFLVSHNENGLIYDNENIDELVSKVEYLVSNPEARHKMGCSAYKTITDLWNADVAAERLVTLSHSLLTSREHQESYQDGPCSIAKIY